MVQRGDKTDVPARTNVHNRSSVLHRLAAFGFSRGPQQPGFFGLLALSILTFGSVELGDLRIWLAVTIVMVGAMVVFVFFRDRWLRTRTIIGGYHTMVARTVR